MAHQHHDHHHHHPSDYGSEGAGQHWRFAIGIILNAAFVAAEATYGVLGNSLSLIADAGHNLSDVLGLLLAWAALWLARRPATQKHTYGYRRASILAALINAALLLVAVGIIIWEAVHRFSNPPVVATAEVMIVAGIGIVINGLTAFLFHRDHQHDLNIKGAYLHMLADAGVSLAVVIGALAIQVTGWQWVDPALSILIALVILAGTWGLFQESLNLVMDGIPAHINSTDIAEYFRTLPGISGFHDLHIWALSTTETALTVHLVCNAPQNENQIAGIRHELKHRFNIAHITIQIEQNEDCAGCN